MSNNSSTASRVAAHNSKVVPYTGWIEGVGYQHLRNRPIVNCYFRDGGVSLPNFEPVIDTSPKMRVASVGGKYRVEQGENLSIIARRFGTTPDAIMAANPSIDWAVARKKGALIYPGELLEIPPVFEEADAQNRPVPRAQVVDAKSFYGEKGRGAEYVRGGLFSSSLLKQGANWGKALFRMHNNMPADAYSVAGNIDIVGGLGADMSFPGRLWISKGIDKGKSKNIFDFGVALGLDVGASVVVTSFYFVGDVNDMRLEHFSGSRWGVSGGISCGFELGGGYMVAPLKNGNYIIGKMASVGVSPPGPSGNINWGKTILD